jgi:hypothetical protein
MENQYANNPVLNWLSGKRLFVEILITILALLIYILHVSNIVSDLPLMIVLLTLAGFYFISGFLYIPTESLITTIASKVAGVASSICTVGIVFKIFHLEGAENQLMIGILSLLPATLVLLFTLLKNRTEEILVLVVRGIVIFSISFWIFNQG